MPTNRGVAFMKPGKVEVQSIDYPKFVAPSGQGIDHGVILRIVSTNICGSDQHMLWQPTTLPAGVVLGHEITGEVIVRGSLSQSPVRRFCFQSGPFRPEEDNKQPRSNNYD